MKILHLCPAKLATGGTEGIHNLVSHLAKVGADASILYVGADLQDPQPKEYAKYKCKYVTEFPNDFKGAVIFPEVWANQVTDHKYKDCVTVVNWQGVDVYSWNVPEKERLLFLRNKKTMHIAQSEYAMRYLQDLGLHPIKISDCLNDDFFVPFEEEFERKDLVLYNPTPSKLTRFQREVMGRCTNELGIRFEPIIGYSREQLIDLFRHRKLYIDFGVFSGRERLPREAVMCGCCILTSKLGTAGFYEDNSILNAYKFDNVNAAIRAVWYVLKHYKECKRDFDAYRNALRADKSAYLDEVKVLYNEILCHNPGL